MEELYAKIRPKRKSQYSHRLILGEWIRDENTWLRAASVVRRRTGRSLINSFFVVVAASMCVRLCGCVFSFCFRFGFVWMFFGSILVHWRLLSLFNMRALEPILCAVCFFALHPFSVGWLIYHFDYWPLYALEYLVRWIPWMNSSWCCDLVYCAAIFSFVKVRQIKKRKTIQLKSRHTELSLTHTHTWPHQMEQATFLWSHADFWTSDTSVLSHLMNNTNDERDELSEKKRAPNDWYLISGCDFKAKFLEFYETEKVDLHFSSKTHRPRPWSMPEFVNKSRAHF